MSNKPQSGILRSKPKAKAPANGNSGHVSFSSNVQTSTFQSNESDDDDDEIIEPSRYTSTINNEYDSDDDDAILASGEGLSMTGRHASATEDELDLDDEAFHTKTEIEEAKKRRDTARHQADAFDTDTTKSNDGNLSLITDSDANPDEYQSNAGSNASCPVEPFNMDAEQDGGLGYFDGDTYVFRKKNAEGEDDAWLDGVDDENEEEAKKGGLDSMEIWKPKDQKGVDGKRKTSKYVSDGDSQDEIGARLVRLLEDGETAMMALTRQGSKLRQLQSHEQKLTKKNGMKKRKAKANNTDQSKDDSLDELKNQIKQIRETVEELTELADALLFEGEADAYELTKADWIHRFKLDGGTKRPADAVDESAVKKPRHNYFGDTGAAVAASSTSATTNDTTTQNDTKPQHEIKWEYKGNEDGVIHGPYTSRQMLEWTSCGYFVGASAVDIRQVGSKAEEKSDADDLMADLMDDEDNEAETAKNEWMRSDAVDFNAYL